MTVGVTGDPPSVGQFPALTMTFAAAGDGAEVPDAVTVRVRSPDGTIYDDSTGVTEVSPGVWSYIGAHLIEEHGSWAWNVSATGPLAGAWTVSTVVPYDPFVVETWDTGS